ncbi:MAG: hypothetical protein ABIF17_01455 [Patescibacteria group bacterium]
MKKNIKILIIVFILFIVSMAVHYYPVYKKGYSFGIYANNLILARNFAETGEFKIESSENIILSSDLVKDKGIEYNPGNELTYMIYGYVFKYFGFNENMPLYFSIILWALSGTILFFLIKKLFNLKVAVIFGVVDIFLPVLLQGVLLAGFYEWAILFFSIGLWFFFANKKVTLNLIFAGFFLGLSILCRNAFAVSALVLVFFEFYRHKNIKQLLYLILPVILVAGLFFGNNNDYLAKQDLNFSNYGHLYPDPYTFHYEKDEYLQSIAGSSNSLFSEYLLKYGQKVSLQNQVIMYLDSIRFYPKEFIKLIVSGGPLIVLLMFLGLLYLFRDNKKMFKLFIFWIAVWYVILVILKTNNWDHFIELRFLIVLLVALGVYYLFDFIFKLSIKNNFKYVILILISGCVILHFIDCDKWMLHEEYNTSNMEAVTNFVQIIKKQNLTNQDVIALDYHPGVAFALNYYTNKNFVYFHPETIKKLLAENKLQFAFEKFGVTHIIGFDDNLISQVQLKSNVKVIQ